MKLIIATHNNHKVLEFKRILEPLGIEVLTADISEPEETGADFSENAFIKAKSACTETGLPAVADDSGICVDALEGGPGIYSARYGGEGLDDKGRVQLMLKELEGVKDRRAHFTSAICCVFPNGDRIDALGECHGEIGFEPRGDQGFGYDPVFIQDGLCFGEISGEEKDRRSHRGKALRLFADKITEYIEENDYADQ